MCGVVGLLSRHLSETGLRHMTQAMADVLHHRGPDDSGLWVDPARGIALGHRRLSIIDLSQEGRQPMASAAGQFIISYNGEVYNFIELRRELEELGHRFRGTSDTEVLLHAIEQWGLDGALPKLAGMFAFALLDRRAGVLHLVCDRLGKKPLYFGHAGRDFIFASELKAFHRHPGFVPEVDRSALTLFLRHGYVPSPYSIYRGVSKLSPGSHLALDISEDVRTEDLRGRLRSYWCLADVVDRGIKERQEPTTEEAVDGLDKLLSRAVAERMIADVPLGALLSGGIDSSTVVALMQKQSLRPIKTFSIGVSTSDYDEAADAKRVAAHLGTDHTEMYVTPEQVQAVIPRLPEIYDEPFGDRSQIPTFLVAQLAKKEVTVALSGDGGDETFGGYNRHFYGPWLWHRLRPWPRCVRRGAAKMLTSISPAGWDAAAANIYRLLPRSIRQPMPGYRVHKLAGFLALDGPEAIYRRSTSYWQDPATIVIDGCEPPTLLSERSGEVDWSDFAQMMMYFDTATYLPDDILVKVDRASMAVSLEVRSPLLDHRLIEFAWRLPASMKVRGRQGKWVLRQVLGRYVSRELINRPKQGFDIPINAWLRGPLREWTETLLERSRLRTEGFFDPEPISAVWSEHLDGKRDHADSLWPILMFQAWFEHWQSQPTALEGPLNSSAARGIG